jgi:hypothetical protein
MRRQRRVAFRSLQGRLRKKDMRKLRQRCHSWILESWILGLMLLFGSLCLVGRGRIKI